MQVEELVQEDSRVERYPKLVKGESKVVWEWQGRQYYCVLFFPYKDLLFDVLVSYYRGVIIDLNKATRICEKRGFLKNKVLAAVTAVDSILNLNYTFYMLDAL